MWRLLLLTALCLATAGSLVPALGRTRGSVAAPRTPTPPIMKKGRKQGGGPAISTRKSRRKSEGQRSADKRITEAVRRAAVSKRRRPSLAIARQRDRFDQHSAAASVRHLVFARAAGDSEWLEVGQVSIAAGAVGAEGEAVTAEQAVRLHKRLILQHATRLHPHLQPVSGILECGLAEKQQPQQPEDAPVGGEAAATHPVPLPSASPLPLSDAKALAATCGFRGAALPAGHYFGDNSPTLLVSDARKVKLSRLGDDSKSAVAIHQSKTLGLRSLG